VVVAVLPVRAMEMTFDEVVDMIAMRNCFMPALWTVPVRRPVSVAYRVCHRIRAPDRQRVLFHAALRGVMKMAIVQVIDVAIVT